MSTRFCCVAGAAMAILIVLELRTAHAQTCPPTCEGPEAGSIVVDETTPHFQRFGPAGGWRNVTGTGFSYYGGSAIWTSNVFSQTENYATWSLPPSATLPLTYEVFVFIPRYHASTTAAHYEIVRGSDIQTRTVNQSRYYAEWVSLGSFYFTAGISNYVRLGDVTGEGQYTRRIGFDAVAFAPRHPLNALPVRAFIPTIYSSGHPLRPTTSRYVLTVAPADHELMGCEAGQRDERGVVILAFGQPWYQPETNRYGVIYYRRPGYPFADMATIAGAAQGFLRGYWSCAMADARLDLGIGTNNYLRAAMSDTLRSYVHGRQWAEMVNQVHAWLQDAAPPAVAARVRVFGANDIEMSWSQAALAQAWLEGYASLARRPMINFGTCDGCPTTASPNRSPNNGWTVEDVWRVNSGVAVAFPEIYLRSGVNADQWYHMSRYAALVKGQPLTFMGLLTQWQACQERGCNGSDNTPHQGWKQLRDALDADPVTTLTEPLPPPSDITWANRFSSAGAMAFQLQASLPSRQTADGVIVEGLLPPLPAAQFLAENAWIGQLNAQTLTVYAGRARNPLSGGLDESETGAIAIFDAQANWQLVLAPAGMGTLRIVDARAETLWLSDGARTARFDLRLQRWDAPTQP
ncbi:MAG: hypothetical protein ACK4WM_07730 [Thermoflexales bacterium]